MDFEQCRAVGGIKMWSTHRMQWCLQHMCTSSGRWFNVQLAVSQITTPGQCTALLKDDLKMSIKLILIVRKVMFKMPIACRTTWLCNSMISFGTWDGSLWFILSTTSIQYENMKENQQSSLYILTIPFWKSPSIYYIGNMTTHHYNHFTVFKSYTLILKSDKISISKITGGNDYLSVQ